MSSKVSSNEVFEMALQIEKMGYDFYKIMAHNATNNHLKTGYAQLAEEESRHIDWFEQLRHSIENMDTTRIDNWDEVSQYFKALIDTKVFPNSPENNSLIEELKDEIPELEALDWMKVGANAFLHEPVDEVPSETITFVLKSIFRTDSLERKEAGKIEIKNLDGNWISLKSPSITLLFL